MSGSFSFKKMPASTKLLANMNTIEIKIFFILSSKPKEKRGKG